MGRKAQVVASRADTVVMRVHIGPTDSAAARAWTEHLLHNLARVRAGRQVLPFSFPADVADAFEALLTEWHAVACRDDVFEWTADMDEAQVRHLVQYWANLDSLTSDHLDRLGVTWSADEARPFFIAIVAGVEQAFAEIGVDDPFTQLLVEHAQKDAVELEVSRSTPAGPASSLS